MSTINQLHHTRKWLSVLSLATVALLAACDRNDTRPGAAGPITGRDTAQVANEAGQRVREASDAVANTAKDLTITTEVKTLLGRDNQLSALKIDVDTNAGQVVLQGPAPNEAARERAADLARSVGGVLGVENKLLVTAAN